MNLKKIKEIVDNSAYTPSLKENLIIKELSKDEDVMPKLMKILASERKEKRQTIIDMNLELSRAHIYIDGLDFKNIKKEDKRFTKEFVLDKISEFYIEYKGIVSHCFNRFK